MTETLSIHAAKSRLLFLDAIADRIYLSGKAGKAVKLDLQTEIPRQAVSAIVAKALDVILGFELPKLVPRQAAIGKHRHVVINVRLSDQDDRGRQAILDHLLRLQFADDSADYFTKLRAAVAIDCQASQDFISHFKFYFPHLPLFLLTINQSEKQWSSSTKDNQAQIGPISLIASPSLGAALTRVSSAIDDYRQTLMETPFWDGLLAQAGQSMVNLHGLPIGNSRSITASISDFRSFYGDAVFRAETVLTKYPLDSLLRPYGTLQLTQQYASRAFLAGRYQSWSSNHVNNEASPQYGTRFLTDGTSAANRTIIKMIVRPNDLVFIERNSHLSHYQALADGFSRTVLIPPFLNKHGIPGPASISACTETIRNALERDHSLPVLIIITNPSFSGVFHRPRKLIESLVEEIRQYWLRAHKTKRFSKFCTLFEDRHGPEAITEGWSTSQDLFIQTALSSLVFLFDEAWAASACLHPQLIEFSAMHAATRLQARSNPGYWKYLRVYSTQSTHKCLSALRQGSMIHYQDERLNYAHWRLKFDHAFLSSTTTSPSASIIASLDIARRQAEMEGLALVHKSIAISARVRSEFQRRSSCTSRPFFQIMAPEELFISLQTSIPNLDRSDHGVDPTKLVIAWAGQYSSSVMRMKLLQHGLQLSRINSKTLLAFFNISVTESDAEHFLSTLEQLSTELTSSTGALTCRLGTDPVDNEPETCRRLSALYKQRNLGWWVSNLGNQPYLTMTLEQLHELSHDNSLEGYYSATFVTAYPPGVPILLPGQLITQQIITTLNAYSPEEILGVEIIDGSIALYLYARIDSNA